MSRKTKVNQETIDKIYELKRECHSNNHVCQQLGIAESTLYDWLSSSSPRHQSEFSEAYYRGIKDSKDRLRDLALSAILTSLKGGVTEQVEYDGKGRITKKVIKTVLPNLGLALNVLQQNPLPQITNKPVQYSHEDLKRFKERFEAEF